MSAGKSIQTTVTDKGDEVDAWVQNIISAYNNGRQQETIVGLDCEWRPTNIPDTSNKTATLQLCVDTKCLIIQLFYIDHIPQSLRNFLRDPDFTFVGVEVVRDSLKLMNEYGLRCSSMVDIQARAMACYPYKFYRKPGLKSLASNIVGLQMQKPLHVCMSNWEARVLDVQQIEYGCIDAYASYRIAHKLLKQP